MNCYHSNTGPSHRRHRGRWRIAADSGVQTDYKQSQRNDKERAMLGTILLIILILLLLGAIPTWPHSRSWGYRPSGFVGIIVIIVVILVLTGHI
jgi:hypothetical protein